MKKCSKMLISCILLVSFLAAGCSNLKSSVGDEEKKKTIGVVVGAFKDTWRTSVRNELCKMAGDKVEVDIYDGNNSQETENEKVDLLISRKVNALVINLVEAGELLQSLRKQKEPISRLSFLILSHHQRI